jgi:predicted small metal-binding protein
MSYELRCADAGASSCRAHITAIDEAELRRKAAEHLKVHGVDSPSETVMAHLVAVAKET